MIEEHSPMIRKIQQIKEAWNKVDNETKRQNSQVLEYLLKAKSPVEPPEEVDPGFYFGDANTQQPEPIPQKVREPFAFDDKSRQELPNLTETQQELTAELEQIVTEYQNGTPEEKEAALTKALRLTEKIMGYPENHLNLSHLTAFIYMETDGVKNRIMVFNNPDSPRPAGVPIHIDLAEKIKPRQE